MRMRYFQSGHHDAHADTIHFLLQYKRHFFAEGHHVLQEIIRYIEDVIDLLFWHDQGMPEYKGADIEECKTPVIFGYLMAGNLTGDDSGKNGGHGVVELKGNVEDLKVDVATRSLNDGHITDLLAE